MAVEQELIKDTNSSKPEIPEHTEDCNMVKCHETLETESVSAVSSKNSVQAVPQTVKYPKPKIITIGDMQIKYDGERVYQKQWCRLTPAEEQNFRIVSDSNNKLVSMTGKHVEARKWVLVEEQSDDGFDTEEFLHD